MIKTSITLPKALHDQVEMLAKQLNISQDEMIQRAIEQFIKQHTPAQTIEKPAAIHQGDIYWLQLEDGTPSDIPHPYVVVQENVFNHSRIHTVVVCALTSNLKRAAYPGNVLLDIHEANLPKQSVVEISKVSNVDKAQLGEYIGSLSEQRIEQIFAGMRFLHSSFFA